MKPKEIRIAPKKKIVMDRLVILITGTPCVGKTTVAKVLAERLKALYINLTDFAKKHNLVLDEDKTRKTTIIDENKMKQKLIEITDLERSTIIIDGHYAAAVAPKDKVTHVFILRRNPIELREFMLECRFKDQKLWENLASEILDVCLVEALAEQQKEKVCELDITGKKIEEVITDIMAVLANQKKCHVGDIDWLGMLEQEHKIDEYLKI